MIDRMFLVPLSDGWVIVGTDDENGPRDHATLAAWGLEPELFKGTDVDYDNLPYPYYKNIEWLAIELGVVLDRTGGVA